MTGQTIAIIIAAVCFVAAVAFFALYWNEHERRINAKYWSDKAKQASDAEIAQIKQEKQALVVACATFKKENTALKEVEAALKAELTETQATCGIWQFKVKRLEEEVAALERGNQELQLQIDAAPKEPVKPVRVKVAKAKVAKAYKPLPPSYEEIETEIQKINEEVNSQDG